MTVERTTSTQVDRPRASGVRQPAPKRQDKRDPRLPVADLFSEEGARRLWESLPAEHRHDHFDSRNMPADYDGAFIAQIIDKGKGWYSKAISLRGLPEPMTWELAWLIHEAVADGRPVKPFGINAVRRGLTLATRHGSPAARAARSLTAMSSAEWARQVRVAQLRIGEAPGSRYMEQRVLHSIKHFQDRLAYAYHDGPWWRLNVWNPRLDRRIPQREHEPNGGLVANFSHLTTDWLREAAKWWLSVALSTQRYVWSSVKSRLDGLKWFQWYIEQAGCCGPALVTDPGLLRPWLRGFRDSLHEHTVMHGPNKGRRLGTNGLRRPLITVETFYRWMFDNQDEAVAVLGEPRWKLLGPQHTVMFLREDKPRHVNALPDDMALDDDVISQIAAGSGLLAAPQSEGGIGDAQAFHALMLLIRTGRRMNEILMMDFDPVRPLTKALDTTADDSFDGDGFVARLAYQQTKIATGLPAVIPVDQEVVDIIRSQQQWAREFIAGQGAPPGACPRYLFVQTRMNRLGLRAYSAPTLHARLRRLNERLAITDGTGRPIAISKTHTFRHTRATDLINAGVPIHVVMRYLGHVTPTMTMHYAQTLAATAEREFLRYKKISADGRTVDIEPTDLFDLLHLDQRADRVLPNGWCMLPPKQVCAKGNACLTCDKFVTDASHRDELTRQLSQTKALIDQRQTQFTARHGEPMTADNIWLAGRTAETRAIRKVLIALDRIAVRDGETLRAVRGAGATDRTEPNPTGDGA